MTIEKFNIDTADIIAAKHEHLRERQAKTPSAAVIALADMQKFPIPVLNVVTGGDGITVIGRVTFQKIYDPVGTGLRYIRAGATAISFFTDEQIYRKGLDDLLLVSRGIKRPVIYQDYILDEYHVAEARAAGAAALTLYASILSPSMLRLTVSLTLRWRMTAIVQVQNSEQLAIARDVSPHVISVGDPNIPDPQHSLALLADLRASIPYNTRVMLQTPLSSLEEVAQAKDLAVDAILVDERLLMHRTQAKALAELVGQSSD